MAKKKKDNSAYNGSLFSGIPDDVLLQDMAKFFCKSVYHGIPMIPVDIAEDEDLDDISTMGLFRLEENQSYCADEDEFIHMYEYRPENFSLGAGKEYSVSVYGRDISYEDPLNHPQPSILINKKCFKDIRKLTAVLLHELLHYYLWYIGWDNHDSDATFLSECKRLGLPDNYSCLKWNYKEKRYDYTYDYSQMDKYLAMYTMHILETVERRLAV